MSFLESNARYLTDYNQWLIDVVGHIESNHIESVKIGEDVVFKLQDEEGKEFYTASIYDPIFEANQFLDGVNFDNTGYLLLGMGSSAIIKSILENKTETAWFLIIEKDTALVKKFLEEVDLSPYLKGKLQRVIILTGFMKDLSFVFHTYINSLIGNYFLQTDLLRTFATYRLDNDYYEQFIEDMVNYLRTHMTSMGNSLDDTLLGMTNELKNIPIALTSHQFSEFKDKYKDKPIICVASGPSLDKQLPLLKKLKGKVLIICAESAFRVLLKNDISPDIVCILERGANSFDLSVKGVEIPKDTALFGLTLMDERIPRNWNEYVVPVFKENIVHSRLLNEALGDMGTLYNGNSVAHLNYALAHYLGGSPIVLIGQDLAYSDEGGTHSKHSFYVDQSDMEMSVQQRKQIQTSLENDEIFFNKTVYLDGYYGEKVKSRELWRQFLHWMEHLILAMPSPVVINATEGGVDIKGTVKVPFSEVAELYGQGSVESIPELFATLSPVSKGENTEEKIQNVIEYFNNLLGEMERISQFAEEVLEASQKLIDDITLNPGGHIDLLEMKASRVLRNVEHIIKDILKNPYYIFFFRPLLSNYHVKMNPISRVSSIERLTQILKHQMYFMQRLIQGKNQVIEVYEKNIRGAVLDLGLNVDELFLDVKPKWDYPNLEEEDENREENLTWTKE